MNLACKSSYYTLTNLELKGEEDSRAHLLRSKPLKINTLLIYAWVSSNFTAIENCNPLGLQFPIAVKFEDTKYI